MKTNSSFLRKSRWPLVALFLGLTGILCMHAVAVVKDELHFLDPARMGLTLPDDKWQEVSFSTVDQLKLAGWYSPTQNGQTILILHGFGGNRGQVLPVAKMLRDQGFGVLSYDTRAHGQSDGKEIGYGETEVRDVKAALDWLESREEVDVTRIGVYGFSLGGYIALQEAVTDQRIATMVLTSTPSTLFGLGIDEGGGGIKGWFDASLRYAAAKATGLTRYEFSGPKSIKALEGRPLLFIAAENDEIVSPVRAWELFEAAGYPKAIAIFPNAQHGDIEQADSVRFNKLILNHFKRTLGKRRVISGR